MNLLQENGFIHYNLDINYSEEDKKYLLSEFDFLEEDPYAPENTSRFRRYANAIIIPWLDNKLIWLPTKTSDKRQGRIIRLRPRK
ncbi:hypothetical protein [Xenorhabdus sp. BG5]|uniref:hypothetical protein n=1 Tax=Xenorhabdus sp. BG5 TaxID=2782014 RepID=UPI001D14032A|nr:hypothetical protein [Xenorhabdus sp. BG5]